MSKYLQNTAFKLGFWLGIILFIAINFYSLSANYGNCVDCFGETGFPFSWMDSGWFLQRILWIGVLAEILFAIVFSFILGLIFKCYTDAFSDFYER